ncbi:(Fe-S)-binding protein [Jiulongibacter sediminis]|uniref:Fe-S oxidoreductase n=1 Tax=Jiulongibacter sediminis TaxID=1605367 RepID=A0A0P7BN95_9BACT|nr:(Fe-S)-binding protein [Jiulongibacter sediminis]KPM48718.1 Fe-S oxidoreductase [Jiulongibacter sediminis]TBX25253.1 Fe-S oxidoreductase [Jiulongibacter sediminis]
MKVSLFIPCYIDQFYPQVGIASLELLEKLGCEVNYPKNQTCCGQPMANSGFQHLTGDIDKHNQQLFADADYVVCPSGSCTLHLKDHVFHQQPKVMELCEFMTDILKVKELDASFPFKVGLHQSCHGLRGLQLAKSSELVEEPYSKMEPLLAMVKKLDLRIPEKADECCGFGGTFAVSEEAVSAKMGQDRCNDFEDIEVDYITSPDMSCLMHLEGTLKRKGSKTRVIHVAEILNSNIQ